MSNVANATTAAATPPGAPTSLIATASGRTIINLSWTPPSENGGATITGFQIEVSTDGTSGWSDLVSNTGSTATIYAHTALDPSSTRFYRVRAINSAGTSDASTTASATTEVVSAPDAPTGLTATLSQNNAVILSWTAPADDGGSPITGYQIDQSPDGITDWTNLIANTGSAATTYILTNLAPDSPRFFRVTAINAIGDSAPSDVVNRPSPNPLSLSMTIVDQFYPLGLLIQDLVLSEALGGTLPFTYTLTPTLPEGLILNNSSHTISGTPTKTMPQTTYTWEVKDADGNTADQEFNMEVYEMSFTQTVSNQSYSRGEPIPMLVLPEATGGKDPIQYILNLLSLPTGLRYDLSTRIINGTPLTVTVPTPMTYKAVDAHGAEDSLKFTIEVVSPVHSKVEKGLPQHFKVKSNYPNPFQSSTHLVMDLPRPAQVQVDVLDITGRHLMAIPAVHMSAGWNQEIEMTQLQFPSGTYLYQIRAVSLKDQSSSVHVGYFMSVR
ncbi:MAG: fibronectin type III domain-containing protein [Bacteroidetes bacterium]|nr:fibronectin type III domain-containing protein [Bacteroidota bacterium]